MAYVTPPTFVADAVLTAADLNILSDDISDHEIRIEGLEFVGVSLLQGTNISIPTAAWTDLPWASAPIDVPGWWSAGASIVVPAAVIPAGYTQVILEIQAAARFDANNTGAREIQVTQNGATIEVPFSTSGISGETTPVSVTVWAVCAASDILKIQVYQSSGANLNCNHANAHIKRIGYQ